jgi:predicted CopG family antitoxin
VSKNISVSDDVYEALKRRKQGRSFSETIREAVDASGQIADVVGQGVLPEGVLEGAEDEIQRLSGGTLDRLDAAPDDLDPGPRDPDEPEESPS